MPIIDILCKIFGHDIKFDSLPDILKHIRENEDFSRTIKGLTVHCKRCGHAYDFTDEVLR